MFVCTCCGHWVIQQISYDCPPRTVLRVKSHGYLVQDCANIREVAKVLTSHGIRIEDLEER